MKSLGLLLIATFFLMVGCKNTNQAFPEYGFIKNNNTIVSSAVRNQQPSTEQASAQRPGKVSNPRIVSTLNKGTKVKLLSRTANKMRVGQVDDYWYKVEYGDGKTGYIFGKEISFTAISG